MFRDLVSRLFGDHKTPAAPGQPASTSVVTSRESSIEVRAVLQRNAVQYPPQDPGFVLPTTDQLIHAQAELLGMLKTHAAVPPSLYEARYLAPIKALAAHIGNLPATASGVFAGEGGLFRACMEMAFYAFRASDGRIFTGSSGVEERHKLEARWRYVCFASAMLYPVGAPLHAMSVLDEAGRRWAPELDPLNTFATPGSQYWVTWQNSSCEPGPAGAGAMLAHHILGRENVDWLNAGSPDLVRRIHEIVTGASTASSLLATSVVKDTWASIHERETSRRHQNYGRLIVGSHISPYVIDAMVMLSREQWKLNDKVMFCDGKQVYLEWPAAGNAIIDFCRERGYRGIPSSEAALLTVMGSNGLVHCNADGVEIVEIADGEGEIIGAVRLCKPGLLVDDMSSLSKVIKRPVTVDDMIAADPIASASPEALPTHERKKPVKKSEQVHTAPPPVAQGLEMPDYSDSDFDDEDEDGHSAEETARAAPSTVVETPEIAVGKRSSAPAQQSVKVQTQVMPDGSAISTGSKVGDQGSRERGSPKAKTDTKSSAEVGNAPQVTFSDHVPGSYKDRLLPYAVEILGRLIHDVKHRPEDDSSVVRMTKLGFAVDHEVVLGISSKAIDALSNWAENGMLYIDPTRPGNKVHQIAIIEGGQKKKPCIVFRSAVAEGLGLK